MGKNYFDLSGTRALVIGSSLGIGRPLPNGLKNARLPGRNFVPGGFSRSQLKDLTNLLGEVESLGLSLPTSRHIRDRFAHFCHEMHGGEKDHSGLFLEYVHETT